MSILLVQLGSAAQRVLRVAAMMSVVLTSWACAGRLAPPATVPSRPLGRDVPVYQPRDPGRRQDVSVENPTGTIALRDAIALTLLHSPDLAAFAWESRAREARALQASRLPNPTLGVLAEDVGASRSLRGVDGSPRLVQPQTTLQLSQLVELGGKRTGRLKLALLDRDLAAWDYEAARMDVLTRATRAFIDVLAAQEMVALTAQTTELVERVLQGVGARVVAGVVSPIEETRADVALAAARVESERASRLLDASRARLAASWGATEARFQLAAGDLRAMPDLPPLAELRKRVTENPDLARWAVEIAQRQAALAIAQSNRIPDVTLTMGYRQFSDLDASAFVVGGSLPLPVFDRNRGGTEEARSRLAKAYEERRSAEARVSVALAEAYRALSSAHAEATSLRSTVLPGSQQTFDAISEGYRLGRFGYLDVLDAQRTLVGAGVQYLGALSDFHRAVSDVERLTGVPLNEIAKPPASPGKE